MNKNMEAKLACPTCLGGLQNYKCDGCGTDYSNGTVLNLFPRVKVQTDYIGNSGIVVGDINFKDYKINEANVKKIINAAYNLDIRSADEVIQKIWSKEASSGDMKTTLPVAIGAFDQIVKIYSKMLPEEKRPFLQSIVTLARYEGETKAGSYVGGFVLPDELLKSLPSGQEYLEIAMGPGDNVKRVRSKIPESIVGCDFSSGMVERAVGKYKTENSLFLRADAQNLPLKSESFDVAMMFNALDRIPNAKKSLKEAYRVLKSDGLFVVGNCIPLQNEKDVEGGVKLVYVPKEYRIETMEEAIDASGCKLEKIFRKLPWNILTIEDGQELLYVDVAIGKKRC